MKNKIKQKTISSIVIGTMLGYNIVPAYATYWDVEGDEAISGVERSALVTYNPSASFMVSVPKTIVLDTKTKSADYNITVKGGIENRTEVVVAPKDNISNVDGVNFYMSDKSIHQKKDVVANVTQESTEWSALEVTESGTTKKGTISAQDISYGDWSGNLIFMIKLCEDHEHTYENGICTECGKTDPNHEHNYTETITKEPTCTEDGEKTLTCNCGDTRTESIPSTGHKFENGSCTECGEADSNHTHSYTETVTKEPTCTEAGEKTLTCACGDSKTESIPARGHNYTEKVTKEATCTEAGEKIFTCACGDSKIESIPATGHNFENGKCIDCGEADPNHIHSYTETVTKEPTCTEAGEKTLTCACGDSKTESIPSIEHNYKDGKCTECGEVDPNHEHSYTETVTKEPTCTEAGEKTLTCACGDSKTESIPSTGHNYKDGKCTECGEADPDYIADPYSLAPEKAYMNWNYTLDETNKTITLNYYSGSETNVIVYSAYPIDGTTYRTKITNNPNNSTLATKYMFNAYGNSNCKNIKSIIFGNMIDVSDVKDLSYMFYNCSSLTSLDLSNFDTGNVTNMKYMFLGCKSLTSLDLSNFDTSNVTDMSGMFQSCSSLTSLDLSNFDTSNVTSLRYMFEHCSSLTSLDLSNFDTSNVTTMGVMFAYCSSLTSLDLSNFDTSNVTTMGVMFAFCSSLTSLDLSNFDTSNVTSLRYMFEYCSSLTSLDLSNFDTKNVTDMYGMFADSLKLKTIYVARNKWVTSQADTAYMFSNCGTSSVVYK